MSEESEVVVAVEERAVGERRSVVVVHRVLRGTVLWASSEATLLQGAVRGQAGLLRALPALEHLQPAGLDPHPLQDDPGQAGNFGPGWQDHFKVPWVGCGGVKGNESDPETDASVR